MRYFIPAGTQVDRQTRAGVWEDGPIPTERDVAFDEGDVLDRSTSYIIFQLSDKCKHWDMLEVEIDLVHIHPDPI